MLYGLSQVLQQDQGVEGPQNSQPDPGGKSQALPPGQGAGQQHKVTLFGVVQETCMLVNCVF